MVYVNYMLRTQVYLPYSQVRTLKQIASEREVSMSEVLRRLISDKLVDKKKPVKEVSKRKKHVLDGLLVLARKFEKAGVKGPSDLATNMDEYLYGGKK